MLKVFGVTSKYYVDILLFNGCKVLQCIFKILKIRLLRLDDYIAIHFRNLKYA